MLSRICGRIIYWSVRLRWLTLAVSAVVLLGGLQTLKGLEIELMPQVGPAQVVVAVSPGEAATAAGQRAGLVSLPRTLAQVEGVIGVESFVYPNDAFFMIRGGLGVDPDRLVIDLETELANQDLPEMMSLVEVIQLEVSDLPIVAASVSSAQLSPAALRNLVVQELQPRLERLPQIRQVRVRGGQELPAEEPAERADTGLEEQVAAPTAEPGRLPTVVIEGAKTVGIEIENVKDVTPDVLRGLGGTAEQIMLVLNLIPVESLRYAPGETLSLLPVEFIQSLEPEIQAELATLAAEFGGVGRYNMAQVMAMLAGTDPAELPSDHEVGVVTGEVAAEAVELSGRIPAVPLPASWVSGPDALGRNLNSTADIQGEFLATIMREDPDRLDELTGEMWRAMPPEATLVVLQEMPEKLEASLLPELRAIQRAFAQEPPAPVNLPKSWATAAAEVGLDIRQTADIPPGLIEQLAILAPHLLEDLTPEMLLALSPERLSELPEAYVLGLEPGLRQTVEVILILGKGQADSGRASGDVPAADPARLPELIIQGAKRLGIELEVAQDVAPEHMRMLTLLGPQGVQLLQVLTPDHLRRLPPESIAMLPPTFLSTLPDALRAELDQLAAGFGGAGGVARGALETETAGTDHDEVDLLPEPRSEAAPVFVPETTIIRMNGRTSLLLRVYVEGEANMYRATRQLMAELQRFDSENPEIEMALLAEGASRIESEVSDAVRKGLTGLVLLIAVTFVLLGRYQRGRFRPDWQVVLAAGLTIPLALAGTVLLMHGTLPAVGAGLKRLAEAFEIARLVSRWQQIPPDITINLITVAGLVAMMGKSAADAIRVYQQCAWQGRQRQEPLAAVVAGAKESAGANAISLLGVVVSLPFMGLVSGEAGFFLLYFGLLICYAMAASLTASITVVPVLSFFLIRQGDFSNGWATSLERWQRSLDNWAPAARASLAMVLFLVSAGGLVRLVQDAKTATPPPDSSMLLVSIQLPGQTSMGETNRLVQELEEVLQFVAGVRWIQAEVGEAGGIWGLLEGQLVRQNLANVTLALGSEADLAEMKEQIQRESEAVFGADYTAILRAPMLGQDVFGQTAGLGVEAVLGLFMLLVTTWVYGTVYWKSNRRQLQGSQDLDGPKLQTEVPGSQAVRMMTLMVILPLLPLAGSRPAGTSAAAELAMAIILGAATSALLILSLLPNGYRVGANLLERVRQSQGG